jgi:hypothetical protein
MRAARILVEEDNGDLAHALALELSHASYAVRGPSLLAPNAAGAGHSLARVAPRARTRR